MNVHIFQYRPEVLTEITALEMSLTIFNTLQVYSFDSFVSSVANPCLVLRLFVSCRPSAGGFLQFFFSSMLLILMPKLACCTDIQ